MSELVLNFHRICEVCGVAASAAERCTNNRCGHCHAKHCTPGGATSPGHGRGTVAITFALRPRVLASWFKGSDYKPGTMDERCANCGHSFGEHYNGRCPADSDA